LVVTHAAASALGSEAVNLRGPAAVPGHKDYVLENDAVAYAGPAQELAADQAHVLALAGASAKEWAKPS